MIDETKAKEIITKNNLSEKTLAVWKNRGAIPARYLKEGYTREKINEKADVENQRFVAWLERNKTVRINALAVMCDINPSKITELKRCKTRLTPSELLRVKNELKKLGIEAKGFASFENDTFKKFLRRDIIVITHAFGQGLSTKILDYLEGKRANIFEYSGEIKTRLLEFAISLNF